MGYMRPKGCSFRIVVLSIIGLLLLGCSILRLEVETLSRWIRYLPRRAQTLWQELEPHPLLPTPRCTGLPLGPFGSPTAISTATPFFLQGESSPRAMLQPTPAVRPPPPTSSPIALPTKEGQSERPVPAPTPPITPTETPTATPTNTPTPSPPMPSPTMTPTVALTLIAQAVILEGFRHEYQTWNNCGPATLAIALSHYGWQGMQADVASALKPDPDDKNVSPEEMATYAHSLGLGALVRVNGDLTRLKLLLSNGSPVIIETWFIPKLGDEMGHYRLLIGYDERRSYFISCDAYEGPRTRLPYGSFDRLWRVSNRIYPVIYPLEQSEAIAAIIGPDMDDGAMYQSALARAEVEVAANPEDRFTWFNMGSSLTGLGRYAEATSAYDRARVLGLPWRMLWYQFGPFEVYYQAGRYDEVLALAEATLRTARNLEEPYTYRGLALQAKGQWEEARKAYQRALECNPLFDPAAEALAALERAH